MKPKHLLSDYLNGRISGGELQAWLANDGSREARKTLDILNLDDSARNALNDFASSPEASLRLAEKVIDIQPWIESDAQATQADPKRWRSKLISAEVVGHSKSTRKAKKRALRKKKLKHVARPKTKTSRKHSAHNSEHKNK